MSKPSSPTPDPDGVPVGIPPEAPPSQAYFWTPEWQAGEREVDEHVARGEVARYDTVEDFVADLNVEPVVSKDGHVIDEAEAWRLAEAFGSLRDRGREHDAPVRAEVQGR